MQEAASRRISQFGAQPVEAGYGRTYYLVEIDGVPLPELIVPVEEPFGIADQNPGAVGGYGALPLRELVPVAWNRAGVPGARRASVLGCGSCGVTGCWPLEVQATSDGGVVTWSDFRQPHRRHWTYERADAIAFDLAQYMTVIDEHAKPRDLELARPYTPADDLPETIDLNATLLYAHGYDDRRDLETVLRILRPNSQTSAVAADFACALAANLGDIERQRLKAFVPRLLSTDDDEPTEQRRTRAVNEWLMTRFLPTFVALRPSGPDVREEGWRDIAVWQSIRSELMRTTANLLSVALSRGSSIRTTTTAAARRGLSFFGLEARLRPTRLRALHGQPPGMRRSQRKLTIRLCITTARKSWISVRMHFGCSTC